MSNSVPKKDKPGGNRSVTVPVTGLIAAGTCPCSPGNGAGVIPNSVELAPALGEDNRAAHVIAIAHPPCHRRNAAVKCAISPPVVPPLGPVLVRSEHPSI